MVYNGPSKGCLACLKRRIKCDEGKPHCQRCTIGRRDCPGYRDPTLIKICDMTATTTKLYKPSEGIERPTVLREIWDRSSSRRSDITTTVRAPPRTSAKQQAFAYLTNCYLHVSPSNLDPGYHNVLNLIARRQNRGNCLEACFSTFAFAAFSRRPASRAATGYAHASYSIALRTVNGCIANLESIHDNEVLAAIVILALVECLIGDNTNGYYHHIYGAMKILKSRSQEKSHDSLGAEVLTLLRQELLGSSVVTFLKQQDQYSCNRVLSVMETTDDPYVKNWQAEPIGRQQNLLVSHIHKIIDKSLIPSTASSPLLSFLSVPYIGVSRPNINDLIENDSISTRARRQYINTATNAFETTDISDYPIEDLFSSGCDVESMSCDERHTWESGQYFDFCLCLSAARLYGYNVVFEEAKLKNSSVDTGECLVIRRKAQMEIDIIIAHGHDICSQQDIEGSRWNDYMWLHRWIPFFVAMGSPFVSIEQRRSIEPVLQHASEVKGVTIIGSILKQFRNYQGQFANADQPEGG